MRPVLRRLENSKKTPNDMEPGRVVTSREELFYAIDKCHHHNIDDLIVETGIISNNA
jgi:hypothetical protein